MHQKKEDFPLPLALLLLGAVIGFIVLGERLLSGELRWEVIEHFPTQNSTLLITSGVLLIFNVSTIIGGIQRWIGFRKQGSRLKSLRGERALFTKALLFRFLISLAAGSLTYLVLTVLKIGEVQWL